MYTKFYVNFKRNDFMNVYEYVRLVAEDKLIYMYKSVVVNKRILVYIEWDMTVELSQKIAFLTAHEIVCIKWQISETSKAAIPTSHECFVKMALYNKNIMVCKNSCIISH